MLAEDFNVNLSTVIHRHKKIGKVWKIAGWVTHKISGNISAENARIFTEILQRNEQIPFLKNLVTGNESWLLFKNVKRKVCVSPGVSPKGIPKQVLSKKALWYVWWD
ncbi:histone-lysine N-methyltransferase SETMAR [Trichonephila inaurata madagascariensis]|uniref:Histone-lysine N-methyltransferase SETMAR n=1 Tax=Trichonephila inaurata madagascariensis TaxID=2747483 RepID=A0A8X6XST8_9ARAC|nr:histone-lysine N-methyltransferase SETMAR [Trichonephila inaurata madagascariensis]